MAATGPASSLTNFSRADLDGGRGGIRAARAAPGDLRAARKESSGLAAYGPCLLPGGWNRGSMRNPHFEAHAFHSSPDTSLRGHVKHSPVRLWIRNIRALRAGYRSAAPSATQPFAGEPR